MAVRSYFLMFMNINSVFSVQITTFDPFFELSKSYK